jgi:xylulokinase
MGVMLSAGGSLRWLRDILKEDSYNQMTAEAAAAPPGAEGLLFLPYLTGERMPHADPHARGAFVGLTIRHGRGHLIRSVLEGVAFGLRDALEIIRARGIPVTQVRVSGGGARSGLWRQILADTFALDVVTVSATEGAAYGAALLAGVGAGLYPSVESACHATITTTEHLSSDPDRVAAYDRFYHLYTDLFLSLKPSLHALGGLAEVRKEIGGVR